MNITPTADQPTQRKRIGFWGNINLARKLLLAFGALFAFAAVIAIVTLNGLSETQAAYENALAQGVEIRQLSDNLQASLLQARTNEKNFLLNWRQEGFYTAQRNYQLPYKQSIADMREQLDRLSALGAQGASEANSITRAEYEADIAALTQNMEAYERSFNLLVNAYQQKGFDDSTADLESQFRQAARQMEIKLSRRGASETGLSVIESTFYRIRLNEKDYLLSSNSNYINACRVIMPELRNLVSLSGELTAAEKTEILAQADIYMTALEALAKLDNEIAQYNKDLITTSTAMEELTAKIKTVGEQLAAEDIARARANSTRTFTTSTFAILFALALSILLAITFSRQITHPLITLTKIAKKISEGNFRTYAEVTSNDEIGTLTQTINDMNVQLRNALQSLEQRAEQLRQQSAQVELTSQQSQARAQRLQIIAEIAHYISREKNLNKLLPLITHTVSEQFGFYHVGVFLLDDSGRYAVLLAANSPGGQTMLRRHHSLEVGQVGIVGNVTASGNPRIAADTGKDAVFFNNPDLPETHSEMALPLRIEGQVIGALDIQSTEINAFSSEDVEVLTILADQLSIAIQNARLLNQFEKSLAEANALQRQYLRETWGKLPQLEKVSGYRYSVAGAIPLDKEVEPPATDTINIPIILRGEEIGALSVQAAPEQKISQDQLDLVKAVAERVALSAENARLFDETTRRAEREHLVSEITTKIRSTTDPQEMIRTAVQELKHVLGVTHVEITSQKIAHPTDK